MSSGRQPYVCRIQNKGVLVTQREMSIKKKILYFTHESRDTLKPFTLFLFVKAISKLDMEHCVKLKI